MVCVLVRVFVCALDLLTGSRRPLPEWVHVLLAKIFGNLETQNCFVDTALCDRYAQRTLTLASSVRVGLQMRLLHEHSHFVGHLPMPHH